MSETNEKTNLNDHHYITSDEMNVTEREQQAAIAQEKVTKQELANYVGNSIKKAFQQWHEPLRAQCAKDHVLLFQLAKVVDSILLYTEMEGIAFGPDGKIHLSADEVADWALANADAIQAFMKAKLAAQAAKEAGEAPTSGN